MDLSVKKILLGNKRLMEENQIDINEDFLKNLTILLNLYKKNKNKDLINIILFLTDYHFYNLKEIKFENIEKVVENKSFVIKNINKFISYNLNQNSLINAINDKLSNG